MKTFGSVIVASFAFLKKPLIAIPLVFSLSVGAPFAQTVASYNQTEWSKVVAAAKKEGKVVFLTALLPGPLARMVAGFKQAYPDIAIEASRFQTGELLTRVMAERAGNVDGADIIISTDVGWAVARAKEGALLRPSGPSTRTWPAKYLREGTNGTVPIVGLEPFVMVYNKTQLTNPPKGYADMLRPELKGKVGIVELAANSIVAMYDFVEKTQGEDFLRKLREQNPKMFVSGIPIAQDVAAGAIALGIQSIVSVVKPLADQGAPVGFVVPNPAIGFEWAMSGLGWAKRPNAALVLEDYIMSKETQSLWHGLGESASPIPGIPGSLVASGISPWDPAAYPPEVVKKYTDRWTKILK